MDKTTTPVDMALAIVENYERGQEALPGNQMKPYVVMTTLADEVIRLRHIVAELETVKALHVPDDKQVAESMAYADRMREICQGHLLDELTDEYKHVIVLATEASRLRGMYSKERESHTDTVELLEQGVRIFGSDEGKLKAAQAKLARVEALPKYWRETSGDRGRAWECAEDLERALKGGAS